MFTLERLPLLEDFMDTSWKKEESFERNQVVLEITSRPGNRGDKLYSIRVGRKGQNRETGETFVSGFLRPEDLKAVAAMSEEAMLWIEADKANAPTETSGTYRDQGNYRHEAPTSDYEARPKRDRYSDRRRNKSDYV